MNTKCNFKSFVVTYSYDWRQRLQFDPPQKHSLPPHIGFSADIFFSGECLPLQVEGQNLNPISFEWHRLEYAEL
jgi:hypothetical protein